VFHNSDCPFQARAAELLGARTNTQYSIEVVANDFFAGV